MKKSILVVGDLMLDVRRYGTSSRTSPEDPRCRVLDLTDTVYELGGAGNVARWLAAQPDTSVWLLGQTGSDWAGAKIKELCDASGIRLAPMVDDKTTIKERVCLVTDGNRIVEQIARVDQDTRFQTKRFDFRSASSILGDEERPTWDGIVVADYGKGVFDGEYGELLREKITQTHHMTIVNAKDTRRWSHLYLKFLVCNDKEALKTWGPLTDHEIVQKCRSVYFVRTRGEHGVTMCHNYGTSHHHPTLVNEAVDVTGAGDAFTAGFAHYLVTEGYLLPTDKENALARGSQWAAHCCGQIGCGMPLGALLPG